ncbi:MAG: hypothetical protein COC20_06085 [Cellvibrionales bacterium]|nr:MAG: hypothetical protein COC20_06085 [Cellvibrionales bacterium]
MIPEEYQEKLDDLQQGLLSWLRAFEFESEGLEFEAIKVSQQRLADAAGNLFTTSASQFTKLVPPDACADLHLTFTTAVNYFKDANEAYLSGGGPTFSNSFLESRTFFGKGLERLYKARMELPILEEFWFTADALANKDKLDPLFPRAEQAVGIIRKPATKEHARYSLYVPETYDHEQSWPVIVALHGGYGTGEDYLWAWLRPAKSKGYIIISPKSLDVTWSVLDPPLDAESIEACIEEVCGEYNVDRQRILLTGLSDGGTFSYLAAFSWPELFAGVAPIAGELSQIADPMLRQKVAKDVPFYVIHGFHDHIFHIKTVQSTCGLLEHLGYNLKFDELPDWGHAYPYKINEERVLPWFESLS